MSNAKTAIALSICGLLVGIGILAHIWKQLEEGIEDGWYVGD